MVAVNSHFRDLQEDDPDASNDELASMMEISLATTDDPQINIAEIPNYEKPRSESGRRAAATWRAKAVHMLYNGDLHCTLRKCGMPNRYRIEFLLFRPSIPTWIDVDDLRQATLKAEPADRGSTQLVMKRLAMGNTATATAQRLAISVTVFQKNGSKGEVRSKPGSLMILCYSVKLYRQSKRPSHHIYYRPEEEEHWLSSQMSNCHYLERGFLV